MRSCARLSRPFWEGQFLCSRGGIIWCFLRRLEWREWTVDLSRRILVPKSLVLLMLLWAKYRHHFQFLLRWASRSHLINKGSTFKATRERRSLWIFIIRLHILWRLHEHVIWTQMHIVALHLMHRLDYFRRAEGILLKHQWHTLMT